MMRGLAGIPMMHRVCRSTDSTIRISLLITIITRHPFVRMTTSYPSDGDLKGSAGTESVLEIDEVD